ncbi:MAG: HD domain-containing protein [Oscillospiraceae bacterium]|nr:HD domain-containing protein [Oscillospiraceae bacterium]
MDSKRFAQQVRFILEADKEKNILRQTHLSGHGRRENDAEHAWHMAIMIWLLREYANEEIDLAKTMMMALIHDIVEIDAGDTYAYDETGLATQKQREEAAAERIFGLLPEDQKQELKALFEEFEAYETPEAKFARAMDNFQPLLLNDSNDGGDWREHGVTRSQILGRHRKTRWGSQEIGAYSEALIEENVNKGNIRDE